MSDPRYPVYVISKGRADSRLTAKALEEIGVSYRIVIEPQEYAEYAAVIDPENIEVLPFSNLGSGSIPARNWVWEHSRNRGDARHWILDDNIKWFARYHRNKKARLTTGVGFRVIEDLADRYENVALAGMQYEFLVLASGRFAPVIVNTRIYSCILIRNDLPFRWRGRYNEDTDLSLRCLKAGECTILVSAIVCKKMATMRMKGGNTEELYRHDANRDGRLDMAKSLQQQHPDVVRIKRRWGRWQHVVDYRRFRNNKLKLRGGVVIPTEVNDYGMTLVTRPEYVRTRKQRSV